MTADPDALRELADRVLARLDADEAEVRVTHDRHGLTRFANSSIHQHVGESTTMVGVRVVRDGRVAGARTSNTAPEALDEFATAITALADLAPHDDHWPGVAPPHDVAPSSRADQETAAATPDQRAQLVADFISADPSSSSAGYLDTQTTTIAFANTAGHRAFDRGTRATIDGIHRTATSSGSAHQTSTRIADLDGARAGEEAAGRARRSADLVHVAAEPFEVVLGPEAVATIASFLGAYGFNAKAHLEGRSFVRVGEAQFDPAIDLADDPTDPRSLALAFDAEGTPRARTPLISDGVTQDLVHDRRTAHRLGTTSTGNAIVGGSEFGPYPGDLVLRAGARPPAELVAGVDRGLLVSQFHYCRVLDPKTLVVTGLTRNGTFLIEGGQVHGGVGNLRFTESFVAALGPGSVLGVGDDDRYADSEFGPGLVIAPSLRLARWNFTGGERG